MKVKFNKKPSKLMMKKKKKMRKVQQSVKPISNIEEDLEDIKEGPENDSETSEIEENKPYHDEKDLDVDDEEDSDDDGLEEDVKHKKSLSKLKETDPEFYKFLQENDRKLLQFNASDSENEGSVGDEDAIHKPPTKLEVDSEEEEEEEKEGGDRKTIHGSVVTLALVESWRTSLTEDPTLKDITAAIKGFHAALDRVTGEESSEWKVEGSAVFNAVVELCVIHLQSAVMRYLRLPAGNFKQPEKSKRWVKVKTPLQSYFTDLLKLLTGVASEHIVSVLLKHLHTACPLVACFSKLSKLALKYLTRLWSTGEETVRVLSFLCILKLCTIQKSNMLNSALKLLYIAYIRNANFVSVNTLPQISFMRRSLSCLFTLNPTLSYQHAFLYIRQLAIHLRNAVTIHKKESFQSVYNWQYVQSLRLWVELLCTTKDSSELQQLLYPLVQIIIGCIKLIPTAQYSPLRFHCIKLLIRMNSELDVYIPVFPFIVESLGWIDEGGQHKKVSMKPFDFTCVLRLSKSAMSENGFKDAIVENVYNLMLEGGSSMSHLVTYPDIIIPTISQLREFLKDCKTGKYTSRMKQLLSKMEENSKFINDERNKLCINILDKDKIRAFEAKMRAQNPPLLKFWVQWNKVNSLKVAKEATNSSELAKVEIPIMKTKKKAVKRKIEEENGEVVLFPSDDEDSDLEIEKPEQVEKKKSRRKETRKKNRAKKEEAESEIKNEDLLIGDEEDILEDLDINNF